MNKVLIKFRKTYTLYYEKCINSCFMLRCKYFISIFDNRNQYSLYNTGTFVIMFTGNLC